jgi:hypothetical protein
MKNPLSREGKLSRRVPEIKVGGGNKALYQLSYGSR